MYVIVCILFLLVPKEGYDLCLWLFLSISFIVLLHSFLRNQGILHENIILTDINNPSVILSEVFWWKSDIILLHLITVYLHIHGISFVENLKWLFGNA